MHVKSTDTIPKCVA